LHVLGHVGEDSPRRTAGWGALAGAVIVGVLTAEHPLPRSHPAELEAGRALVTLLLSVAPALLLGYLAAGALHAFGPAAVGGWLGGAGPRAGRLGAALRGTFAGLVVPVCACGTLPTYRRLLEAGAAPAAGLAFLVAGPEMGVGAVLVSLPLLGAELTAVRIGAATVVALVTGLVVARWAERPEAALGVPSARPRRPRGAPLAAAERPGPLRDRAREALRFGLVETVDHTAPWVLAGLGVAVLTEPLLPTDALVGAPDPLVVLAAALLGVPAYVCASGVTPLVAVLLHKGLSTGAAVAFLLTGPATNLVALAALRRLHGPAAARAFGLTVTAAAVALGLLVDHLLPGAAAPALHTAAERPFDVVDGVAAAALVVLFAASLVRNGAAGFLEPLLQPHGHDEDDGDGPAGGHRHDHAHDEDHAGHHHAGHDHHAHDPGGHPHDCAAHDAPVTLDIGAWKRRP
ncbi:MAG: permease, partial [Myxococcota bacterium]